MYFQTEQFAEEARRSVSPPVYFPYEGERGTATTPQNKYLPLSARMLRNAGIEYFDPTSCLIGVGSSDAYVKEGHYSPQANTQIARCLEPVLRDMINGLKR